MDGGLSKLTEVSINLGRRVAYVQGGGGNTSLKTTDSKMFIKASGTFLADLKDAAGFLPVDWRMLRSQLNDCISEQDYSALLAASVMVSNNSARPSIETGFHAILDKCVLHSHSIWANLLSCTVEGENLVYSLFPQAIWVPYVTPGLALTKKISKKTGVNKKQIIFLQNHGIIISAPDPESAWAMHESVTRSIRNAYPAITDFDETQNFTSSITTDGLLFPDQAIYHSKPELSKTRAGYETAQACSFLLKSVAKVGLTLCYIEDSERDVLLNMESEKFRQKLVGE